MTQNAQSGLLWPAGNSAVRGWGSIFTGGIFSTAPGFILDVTVNTPDQDWTVEFTDESSIALPSQQHWALYQDGVPDSIVVSWGFTAPTQGGSYAHRVVLSGVPSSLNYALSTTRFVSTTRAVLGGL